jgi:pimeloyl-ACP methyl ester carboxylesterase
MIFKHPPLASSLIALAIAATVPAAHAATGDAACQALLQAGAPNLVIQKVEYIKASKAGTDAQAALTGASGAGATLPAHCMVQGMIEPRTGADGKPYGVGFELRLPDDWQNRLLFQGGGGLDGFLAQAIGSVPVHSSTATPALARGYAVVSMDGGHRGRDDASFAHDQQARLDYAYQAIGKVTTQAKRLVAQYYSVAPKHTYFMGCSNGGREAMLAAQRYPLEFDGVVAANAGFHLSRAAIGEAWDTQAFMKVAPKDTQGRPVLAQAFTPADLKLVSDGVLNACDALDGIKDGLINNYTACHFDPKVLQCKAGKNASCLTSAQVDALHKIFGGAKNSRGDALYSSWPYDAGIDTMGWRDWKLGDSTDATKPNARNVVLGGPSLGEFYTTPPKPGLSPLSFDFDRDVAAMAQTGALNDATSTYLNTFEARGGKLLIVHGLSDPVFSADDIMHWYDQVRLDTNAGDAAKQSQWSRLFMVPGMTHCGGGSSLDDFDPLAAIEVWVEKGEAPASILARGKAFPGKEQPLCPYPQTAQYKGGDPDSLKSYACVSPVAQR